MLVYILYGNVCLGTRMNIEYMNSSHHYVHVVHYFAQVNVFLCNRHDADCIEVLTWLTKVARFSVAVMFLSKTDKNSENKV